MIGSSGPTCGTKRTPSSLCCRRRVAATCNKATAYWRRRQQRSENEHPTHLFYQENPRLLVLYPFLLHVLQHALYAHCCSSRYGTFLFEYFGLIAAKLTPTSWRFGTGRAWFGGASSDVHTTNDGVSRARDRRRGEAVHRGEEAGPGRKEDIEKGNTLCSDELSGFNEFIRLSSRGLLRKSMRLCGACVCSRSPLAGSVLALPGSNNKLLRPQVPFFQGSVGKRSSSGPVSP